METLRGPVPPEQRREINANVELFEIARAGFAAEKDLDEHRKYHRVLTTDEHKALNQEITSGQEVAWQIAWANQGLARKVARSYSANMRPNGALDEEDIFVAALHGLFDAARHYKHGMGASFSTYALISAKHQASREIDNISSTVRVPINRAQQIRKHDRVMRSFYQEHRYYPSTKHLANMLGMYPEQLDELRQSRLLTREMGSLDTGYSPQIEDPSDASYGQIMQSITDSEPPKSTEEQPINKVRSADIRERFIYSELTDREIEILKMRFGIGYEPRTLEEIGQAFGISRGRILQIESAALAKLRHQSGDRQIISTENFEYTRMVPVYTDEYDENGRRITKTEELTIRGIHRVLE